MSATEVPVPPAEPLAGGGARGFAWLVVKLRFLVVAAWIAGAIAATIFLPSLSESRGSGLGELIAEDSEAIQASLRSAELFSIPLLSETAVVQRDGAGLQPDAQRRVLERAVAVRRDEDGSLALALPILNDQRLFPGTREASTTAITFLFFDPDTGLGESVETAHDWTERTIAAPDDHLIGISGAAPARLEQAQQIGDALPLVEAASVAFIALLLGLSFRSIGAPLVILASAAIAYIVAVRLLPEIGDLLGVAMPPEIEPLVVVLLLGIVTDYAIFFLSGFRGQLVVGRPRLEAARRSTARNVAIVLTAGLIVTAGALTLLAGELDYFRALGPGLALTAGLGLFASVTLVPALLAIFGRAVFWPGKSVMKADANVGPPPAPVPAKRPLRERIALLATAKPAAALIVLLSAGGLVAAGMGLTQLTLGFTLIRGLPEGSEARQAETAASQGFTPGILEPTELLVEQAGVASKPDALARLEDLLRSREGVAGVLGPLDAPQDIPSGIVVSEDDSAARFALVFDEEPLGGNAIDDLRALDEAMPALLAEAGLESARASFAGDTALARDTVSQTLDDLKRIAVAALGVNLLFLVLFLRSLVAPLFLLLASVLALAATLGLTAYVFQGLLGYDEVTYYVPFAAAVLLVSLGSDYNVFVVGRVWEEARRRPLREAVATAVPRASKTITLAGLALAGSFALLALVPLRSFRELAFALSVGVLLDAFVVRTLLVPALISLFGEVSWWPGGRRLLRDTEEGMDVRDPAEDGT